MLKHSLAALACLTLAFAFPKADAATTTNIVPLSSTTYTDLGAGPILLGANGGNVIYQVSDAQPAATSGGHLQRFGDAPALVETNSHIWAIGANGGNAVVTSGSGAVVSNVSAGQVVEVCVTPTVTVSNAYGTNYVVGGLLSFSNALPPSGGGVIQSVYVQVAKVETVGFTFTPLASTTTATTWTDAAVANINLADVKLPRGAISLSGSSVLGTHTTASSNSPGPAIKTGSTTLLGVLTVNGPLTNNFGSASDLTVCVDGIQFP